MRSRRKKKIVLASTSPRRKKLLKKICRSFQVIPSHLDESKLKAKSPEGFAVKAAIAKAEDIALKKRGTLVIGADTIVVLGKKILGKPKNKKDAIRMLKSLSGRIHQVITGIAIIDSETFKTSADYVVTKVQFKKLSDKTIFDYVQSGKPLDKAGSYGIQEIENEFGIEIKGDYNNVVGLPLKGLKKLLCQVK
ncbi:MAG: Maf family protein [Candidatus Margulisiibacteriota bacterium]|nr:Maf family protein [Candidatus Margulisiibacteriota bacterium]